MSSDNVFIIDVKRRVINNTPWDVHKLAAHVGRTASVEVIDLRFASRDELPPAQHAYLFLETAATWMCFDWNEPRFLQRLAELASRYPRITVVGPQARALQAISPVELEAIDSLEFESAIAPDYDGEAPYELAWLRRPENARYNGERFERGRYWLGPTVSVVGSMNCPMRCSFCFYGGSERHKRTSFERTMTDIERMSAAGWSHFYFTDPNFVLSREDWKRLRRAREARPGLTYYCQVSPNLLTDAVIAELAATGCHGMVIGIENAEQIRFKGEIDGARRRVERVISAGMMPTLYVMIDGKNDVRRLVDSFDGVPFRYSILNEAFASDRSCAAIRAGFAAKAALASAHADTIAALRRMPNYLENIRARSSEEVHA